jgi:hypothetical protein
MVIGRLTKDARPGRSPVGDPVTLLEVEFPVDDPQHPKVLWTWARFGVEVPDELAVRHQVKALRGGVPIFASGQLSERWVIESGRSSRRGAIVADLVYPDTAACWMEAFEGGSHDDR